MEYNPLSTSEQKIQEYVTRIKAGESKHSIMQGLPPSFVAGIEAGMKESKNTPESKASELGLPEQKDEIDVPPQYIDLDSDTLDFIWTIPEYVDREKTEQEKVRKKRLCPLLENENSLKQKNKKRNLPVR